jgi:acetylornithine/N-succinyldiaminopimelate aminotransferase
LLLPDVTPTAVEARDRDFVLGTYARTGFHPRRGKGAKLIDADGREFWDLLGGIAVSALGHDHPRLRRAFVEESRRPWHVSNLFYHPAPGLLAESLVRASGLSKVFFCNSGTEANEAALKLARLVNPGRVKVIALEQSFHGRTFGALSLTGHAPYREPFLPLVGGVEFVKPNDTDALRAAIDGKTSAVFMEPILGEGGVIPLSTEFLAAARELCSKHGAVLVLDEIQCGLGRTGKLFAFENSGVVPDMVTLAKPIGGGLPLGAVVVNDRVASVVKPGQHGTTFGGNPVACRLGLELLATIEEENLLARVRELGGWLGDRLHTLRAQGVGIVDVRGAGMMWGIELDRPAKEIAAALLSRGFVVGTSKERVLRLLPSYLVPRKALVAFLTALVDVLGEGR